MAVHDSVTLRNGLAFLMLNIHLPYDYQSYSLVFALGKWKLCSQKYLQANVYITTALFMIIKNWKQSRCPSTGEWVNKLWLIIIINTSPHKKKQNIETHTHNLDEFQEHYAEWKKPVSKVCTLNDYIYKTLSKR